MKSSDLKLGELYMLSFPEIVGRQLLCVYKGPLHDAIFDKYIFIITQDSANNLPVGMEWYVADENLHWLKPYVE